MAAKQRMRYDITMFKQLIRQKLESYVYEYFKKHPEVKLVVITGSVGKTSTKRAVATLLSQKYRVRMHEGNYNSDMAAPLAMLGIEYPENIRNPLEWLAVFKAAKLRIAQRTDVDVVIQELGTDRPGDIAHFGKYLKPDLAIITAVTPEHMEFFGTLDAVAKEELSVSSFSGYTLINRDDIDGKYADFETNPNFSTYGLTPQAEYRLENQGYNLNRGYNGLIVTPGQPPYMVQANVIGEHSLRPVIGAAAAATILGLNKQEISEGVAAIKAVPGRMNLLPGIDGTTIIDDTYNSSPAAAEAAMRTLYTFDLAPQRIAVMGSMNELGATSQNEHEKLAQLCDPNTLGWLVTVGGEANKYLAPAARARGVQVKECENAIAAGEFVRSVTEPGAVILVKGSQGGIYLEEAVKILCLMSRDVELVRQSSAWMNIKDEFFSQVK